MAGIGAAVRAACADARAAGAVAFDAATDGGAAATGTAGLGAFTPALEGTTTCWRAGAFVLATVVALPPRGGGPGAALVVDAVVFALDAPLAGPRRVKSTAAAPPFGVVLIAMDAIQN